MNKTKYIFVLGLSVFMTFFTSCKYGDTNVDPTRPADVNLNLILPTALAQASFNQMSGANRLTGILMQHFDGFDAQQIDYTIYNINENVLDNYWNFGLYGGVMKDAIVMMEKGVAEEQPYYVGIAKLLMANALGNTTSIFGDAPYSDAFKGTESLKPTYDTQEQVYGSIQTLLDEAIAELSKPAVGGGPASDDLIFGGDASKWIATAHALKARYYMHLTKRDASAQTKALAEIGKSFTSNDDQPDFIFDASAAFSNPMAQFGDQRPNTLILNQGFVDLLSDTNDPRDYLINSGGQFYNGSPGLFWSSNDSPSPLISFTEIKFMQSEALVRDGDFSGANTAMIEAIRSNMDYMDVVKHIDDLKLTWVPNPGDTILVSGDSLLNQVYMPTIPNITSMPLEKALETIMDQSYVALYGQAEVEVWTNYRRTGYPALIPNPDGSNGNNPSGVLPRRIPYPQNERITNEANLNAAKANQGGDLLDVDLWAFK